MYTVWVVSEQDSLSRSLAVHAELIGRVYSGQPRQATFKDAEPPDAVVVARGADPGPGSLELLLGFLQKVPRPDRNPAPVLWIESGREGFGDSRLARLVDDRPMRRLQWPFEPERMVDEVVRLISNAEATPGLRERARRDWIGQQIECLYAGLELPALRHAIDPRNSHLPILLVGAPGTRKGLLARYSHMLAEPPRARLETIAGSSLVPGEMEERLIFSSLVSRSTCFVSDLERAEPAALDELAQLWTDGGASGVDAIRWIASISHLSHVPARLRGSGWLRVELPPVRERPDRRELANSLIAAWCEKRRRSVELSPSAYQQLESYEWPGNLRELENTLEVSLSAADEQAESLLIAGEQIQQQEAGPVLVAPAEYEESPTLVTLEPIEEFVPLDAEPNTAQSKAPLLEVEPEPEPSATEQTSRELGFKTILAPLSSEIRQPLRAIRTYANLLEQRPDNREVRRELANLVETDLSNVEAMLQRLEEFSSFGAAKPTELNLARVVGDELRMRHAEMRKRELVVLRELDEETPALMVDEKQLRFVIRALLDRALRMVPVGGDLYIGSLYRPGQPGQPSGHRVLLRFHSPEEVLSAPDAWPGAGTPLEVLLARAVIERMGGAFATDASGYQDNLVLIELPD